MRFILCLLFFIPFKSTAQINDAGVWASITVEKKITSKFTASITEELRFNENASEIGTIFTEFGLDYKIIKNLTAGLAYRYIQKRRVDDFYSERHRGIFWLTYKIKVKKLELSIKERYQFQYTDINTSDDGKIPASYLRSKLTLKYNSKKKYTPFLATELFYQLNNVEGNELDDVRYSAGITYKFNKQHSVDLFYLINREFNVNDPVTDYVSGIGYTFTF